MADQVVTVARRHEDDMVTSQTWVVTPDEADAMTAELDKRFGPHRSALLPAEMLAEIDADPRFVSDDD